MTTQKPWKGMLEAERMVFKVTPAYLDPTNPARVPWGEWSVEARGAVALAFVERDEIEVFDDTLAQPAWETSGLGCVDSHAYRIPPEPKRETVQLKGYRYGSKKWTFGVIAAKADTHSITIPTIDGKPVLTKCPHCGTAPVDMEEFG